jgi:tetratricopeptide (TPR) repeat protein
MNQLRLTPFCGRVQRGIVILVAAVFLAAPLACVAGGKPPRKADVNKVVAPPSTDDLLLDPSRERRADALARYAAGFSAELRRDYDTALAHYRKAVELEPDAVVVHNQIIEILLRHKRDLPAAAAHLERAIRLNPKNFDLRVRLGDVLRDDRQYEKAIQAYRKAIELDPQGLLAYARLAGMLSAQKKMPEAVRTLDEAAQQPSKDSGYWVRLGNYYRTLLQSAPADARQLGIPQKAVQSFEKAAALAPTDSLTLLQLAQAHQLNQDIPAAIVFYNKVLALKPDEFSVRRQLLDLYAQSGEKQKALGEWDKLIESLPDTHVAKWEQYFERGKLYAELKQHENALEDFRRAAALNPRHPDPRVQLAFSAMNLKKLELARETLEKAQQDFPKAVVVQNALAVLHAELKQYDKAVAAYERTEVLAQESNIELNHEFYFFYGAACERNGDRDRAALLFEKAIELNPRHANALNYLGYMWADNGMNLDRALDLIKRAVELEPDNAAFLDSLGWAYFRKGNFDEALKWLNKAESKLKQPEAEIYDHLAEVHEKRGAREEAIRYWKKALEAEPDNTKIQNKLQRALEISGQKEKEVAP